GVFINKNSFKDKDFCGFCVYDKIFPIIYLNSGTTKTKQIFTLFHELAHVLLRTGGITTRTNSYIAKLQGHPKVLERYCDEFAVEFLVPEDEFNVELQSEKPTYDFALELGDIFKVSAEVIIRRMHELNYINRKLRDSYLSKRYQEVEQSIKVKKKQKSGPDYYIIQTSYMSNTFLQLVFKKYYEGGISTEQVAEHLRIKTKSIPGIEELVLKRGYNI
ncbi:ImmA/IrrE family metallo-endopeptidase, partial [bacterium]|nr:ImmA/IrrE family metallo-endopeptidase [bacterium]